MIKRIVLTGGPCAGKTTVLSLLEKELREKGYRVFIVSESATELIRGGITPHSDSFGMLEFQKIIMSYQYRKEEVYNNAALRKCDENVVIIYDRGLLDNKAYISDEDFVPVLESLSSEIGYNINENDILARYDMVIHLRTSAGNKGYSLENNNARYESEQEAILLDRRTQSVWSKHNNLQVVESTDDFSVKIDNVFSLVDLCLSVRNDDKKKKKIK